MSQSSVVDKVKKKIEELEQAIQRLDFVKHHLNQNSSEIKSQIHTSISRHLETLRNREVWLLGQVDTVLGLKEEVLHRQQARINKALGVLHSGVAHADTIDDDTAAKHLAQALKELTNTELKAEETPYIAFRADHVALRESILSYGRVDANGLPLQSAFADFRSPSASLPRHLEEYEDSEHHVFYKTLQDGKFNAANIRVSMPKLSTRVEDWLQRPMLHLSTSLSDPQLSDAGSVHQPLAAVTQTCSIQNWLSQIKNNPDVEEEDDFEIVDHSCSSQRESPLEEEAEKPELLDLRPTVPQDARQWLVEGSSASPKEEDLRAFFKHIPKDTDMWLLTAQRQLQSLEKLKTGSWFHHIPTETSSWLRRAHDKQAATSQAAFRDFFAHITKDVRFWLLNKGAEMKSTVAKEPVVLMGSPASALSSPTPLAFIPDLLQDYKKKLPSDLGSWLLKKSELECASVAAAAAYVPCASPSCNDTECSANLPGMRRFLESSFNTRAWLAGPANGTTDKAFSSNFFSHISTNKSDWLKSGVCKGSSNSTRPVNLQSKACGNLSKWLRSGSPLVEVSSTLAKAPLDNLREFQRRMNTADWLSDSGQACEDVLPEKSWSVVSSSSSVSSTVPSSSTGSEKPAPPLTLASWIYQKHL